MKRKQVHVSNIVESRIADCFEKIVEAYKSVEGKSDNTTDKFYRIAKREVKLSFASSHLVKPLTDALTHLEEESLTTPDLTIYIFESKLEKHSIDELLGKDMNVCRRGEIAGFNNDRYNIIYHHPAKAYSVLDKKEGIAVYLIEDHKSLPYWDTGAPFMALFHLWCNSKELQLIHSAAIGNKNEGALIIGRGGSGKSTTALSSLQSNLYYAADDYTIVSCDAKPEAFSLYNTAKKNADDLERLNFLAPYISNKEKLDSEKALFFLHEHFPEKIINSLLLKAILIPRITQRESTSLELTNSANAANALIPSTITQLPCAGKKSCQIIMNVTNRLPCYFLNLGTNMKEIPLVIENFLSSSDGYEKNN